jgi:hypothetical protein
MQQKESYTRGGRSRTLMKAKRGVHIRRSLLHPSRPNASARRKFWHRNLTPSQRAALALEIEKQLAAAAKKRRAATLKQNQATVVATLLNGMKAERETKPQR